MNHSITDLYPLAASYVNSWTIYLAPTSKDTSKPWNSLEKLMWNAITTHGTWPPQTAGCGKTDWYYHLGLQHSHRCLTHCGLLEKLEHYGIEGASLIWLKSLWLGAHSRCSAMESAPGMKKSGVPQWTVLGQVLFLLRINGLPTIVDPHTHCKPFADYYLIYRVINNIEDQA